MDEESAPIGAGGRRVTAGDEQASGTIRVFIVAEVALYRIGLAEVIARDERVEVIGTASTASAALAEAMRLRPDVLLLDVALTDGPQAVGLITAALPDLKVVALGLQEVECDVMSCVEAGACGFVTREASVEDLVASVESVTRGEALCSPRMAASLLRRLASLAAESRPSADWFRLTRRELEIVGLMADGLSNKEIAGRLHIELPTVKNHVHNIFEKLDVHRRTEVVARLRRGSADRQPAPRY
jgi:two-component system, NarL family, nitrate/nitrite response regulator NarL